MWVSSQGLQALDGCSPFVGLDVCVCVFVCLCVCGRHVWVCGASFCGYVHCCFVVYPPIHPPLPKSAAEFGQFVLPICWVSVILPICSADLLGLLGF